MFVVEVKQAEHVGTCVNAHSDIPVRRVARGEVEHVDEHRGFRRVIDDCGCRLRRATGHECEGANRLNRHEIHREGANRLNRHEIHRRVPDTHDRDDDREEVHAVADGTVVVKDIAAITAANKVATTPTTTEPSEMGRTNLDVGAMSATLLAARLAVSSLAASCARRMAAFATARRIASLAAPFATARFWPPPPWRRAWLPPPRRPAWPPPPWRRARLHSKKTRLVTHVVTQCL